MDEKTPLELLDEIEGLVKKKKHVRYFFITGFSFLFAHSMTHIPLLLIIAIGLFCVAIFRHIQIRVYANKNLGGRKASEQDSDIAGKEAQAIIGFSSDRIMSSISFRYDEETYKLTFLYEKKDWEEDDILLCESSDKTANIHPKTFLQYLKSTECSYIHTQDKGYVTFLENAPCLKFSYLEDSRDYPSISIDGTETEIRCKYLCPVFYILTKDEQVLLIVEGLRDSNGEDIPALFTDVKNNLFLDSSAEFDEEESVWVQI